jgi:hypothetical protein
VAFISSANLTASYKQDQVSTIETWNANQEIISNLCITLAPLLNPKPHPRLPQKLIPPVVKDAHFFVGCLDFSVNDPDSFINISFYDSLCNMPVSLILSLVLPWTLLGRPIYFSTPSSSTRISSHVSDKQKLTCFVVLITKCILFRQMATTVESSHSQLPCILWNKSSCIGIFLTG